MTDDTERGLYRKFHVRRLKDTKQKHAKCHYFVLDLDHDKHAIPALRSYAASCREEYPQLAFDLDLEAHEMDLASED